MILPIKTMSDIRELLPCYDPSRYAPEDWQGTALDVLRAEQIPAVDRIWLVCHQDWIDDRILRLFAVWCARQALALVDNPDPHCIAVWDTAWDAARAATWAATWAAHVAHLIEMLTDKQEV